MTEEELCTENSRTIVSNKYKKILKYLEARYKQLRNKLVNEYDFPSTDFPSENSDVSLSFADLINKINDIPAIEYYYDNNIKPLNNPNILDSESIENMNYTEYNMHLAKQINYYMRLLGYYLILKGVDINLVNNALNLESRIALLDFIQVYKDVQLSVDEQEYKYMQKTSIPYTLRDISDNNITVGNIILGRDGKIIRTITAGEELFVTPKDVGLIEYHIIYEGYGQYRPVEMTYEINVLKNTPEVDTSIFTAYDSTETYTIDLEIPEGYEIQPNASIYLRAIVYDLREYAISNEEVTFEVNGTTIGTDITDGNGIAEISYTIPENNSLVIRAHTNNQVSNYIHTETISYFNILKNMLHNTDHVYMHDVNAVGPTGLWEDENGIIVGTPYSTSLIQNVSDLNGIIYDMTAARDRWGYKVFNTNRNYIKDEEFTKLMNILIDYEDNGEELTIMTLGDNNE